MLGALLQPELEALIEERQFAQLREILTHFPPADVAEILTDLTDADKAILLRLLPHRLATDTFAYLNLEAQTQLIQALGREEVATIINDMPPDDRTALLEELPSAVVTGLLQLLKPEELKVAKQLLGYPERSVGRLMTPDFITARNEWTVQQVLDYIRQYGKDTETLNVVYAVDEAGTLLGDMRIREFLLRPLQTKVSELY